MTKAGENMNTEGQETRIPIILTVYQSSKCVMRQKLGVEKRRTQQTLAGEDRLN